MSLTNIVSQSVTSSFIYLIAFRVQKFLILTESNLFFSILWIVLLTLHLKNFCLAKSHKGFPCFFQKFCSWRLHVQIYCPFYVRLKGVKYKLKYIFYIWISNFSKNIYQTEYCFSMDFAYAKNQLGLFLNCLFCFINLFVCLAIDITLS